jgi:hypothetical protein
LGCTLLLWFLSLRLPEISYLALWPLVFGVLPVAWAFLAGKRTRHPAWPAAVLTVAAVPAIVLLPETIHSIVALLNRFEGLMGLPMLGLAMLFVAPLIGLFGPHFELLAPRHRLTVAGIAALVAIALIGWGNATSGFDATHPRPDRIAYELNADTSTARWLSQDTDLDAWTTRFFPAGTLRGADGLWTSPAPAVKLAAPQVAVVGDTRKGETRTLVLRLQSPRGATDLEILVRAAGGPVVSAAVDGKPLDLRQYPSAGDGVLRLIYTGLAANGYELTLVVRTSQPVTIAVADTSDGLPAVHGVAIQARPSDTMAGPGDWNDPTIVKRTFTY